MRTTVTLDPDTEQLLRRRMREQQVSFKVALNDAIRAGLATPAAERPAFRTPTAALGVATVNLDRALTIAADLEDEELVRKQRRGS